ncbi:phosphatidylglycerophosphate synthase [Allocatelliglobosispora scoriae]|uniref:Phosphatidylglycerophosphate synthase n=1 Tax=Allocatelliglobosispora scoriae TaxID=643052 RepID=A0A841BWL4_9ACTN|nr:phosphatidylglycerophosphate synthase [Allocatelliglobosispora scoriae]
MNRGGGLFSEGVSQWIGAVIASTAARLRLKPTHLTLINLVIGIGLSTAVVLQADSLPRWLGALALVGWQAAYAFDCADGQLARVTGQGSIAGARIDIICDVATQIALVTALAAVAEAPVWLAAAFAGTWMVNLVTSVLATSDKAASMVTSTSLPVRLVKLIRDYGALILVAGLVLTFAPQWMIWVVGAFTVINGVFLIASIAFTARAALR